MFTLTRTKSLDDLLNEFDQEFGGLNLFNYNKIYPSRNSFYRRKGEVTKTEDEYVATLALPGFSKEDLDISFEKSFLTVSAEIEADKQTEFVMTFSETMHVSSDVDASKIKATLENGILEIRMPVLKERQPKKIKVD